MLKKKLILASASPRRRELLTKMGYEFTCDKPDVDENVSGSADKAVVLLAKRKARAVAARHKDGIIIASDTLVSLDGAGLGKPADAEDAVKMLKALSGREHEVLTGVCFIDAETGREQARLARTGVTFRELSEKEINEYVETGEPMDKAGAYAIQGGAGGFVTRLDGTFENVMGFPIDAVDEMIKEFLAD